MSRVTGRPAAPTCSPAGPPPDPAPVTGRRSGCAERCGRPDRLELLVPPQPADRQGFVHGGLQPRRAHHRGRQHPRRRLAVGHRLARGDRRLLLREFPNSAMAFTPDGSALVTAGMKVPLSFRIPSTGKVTHSLSSPVGGAQTMAFSADGTQLVVAGNIPVGNLEAPEICVVWDVAAKEQKHKLPFATKASSQVNSAAFIDGGDSILLAGEDLTEADGTDGFWLWNLDSGDLKAIGPRVRLGGRHKPEREAVRPRRRPRLLPDIWSRNRAAHHQQRGGRCPRLQPGWCHPGSGRQGWYPAMERGDRSGKCDRNRPQGCCTSLPSRWNLPGLRRLVRGCRRLLAVAS